MKRFLFTVGLLASLGSAATAQYPNYPAMPNGQNPQTQFAPNFYDRASQPLSPYLNLLRGGDPAINYFYGVRPGTLPGTMPMGGPGAMRGQQAFSQLRMGYLPAAANPTQEPTPIPEGGVPIKSLPPSGHAISFGPGMTRFAPMTGGPGRPGVFGNSPPPAFNRNVKK